MVMYVTTKMSENVTKWLNANRLTVNMKNHYMIFHRAKFNTGQDVGVQNNHNKIPQCNHRSQME